MPLVAAKCTQCGANIEVDDTKEAGICKYCGTAYITEKAITNYNTYITNNNNFTGANINVIGGNIDNLIELAKNALEINDEKDTLKYCEKALEINVKSAEAWFIKMQGEKIKIMKAPANIENAKSIESISVAGNNAIKYENDADKGSRIKAVHRFYLESVKSFLSSMKVSIEYDNVETLRRLADINKGNALAADQMFLLGMTTKEMFAIKLIEQISPEEFLSNEDFRNLLVECINLDVEFRDRYRDRTLLYSNGPNVKAAETMKNTYDKLVALLPEEKRSEVFEWTLVGTDESESGSTSSGGCYVATCVYGSYDCPEVWTLRRFRDYTLDATWHGRLFVKCYYAISPTIVKWFGETKGFKHFWKTRLDKMVSDLNNKGVENTSYTDKY